MSEINYVSMSYLPGVDVQNTDNALSFAWENINNDFFKQIKKKVEDAKILIIIGYSFPYFNREIDRQIIGEMTQLEKVYIQDPNANEVKESFEAVLSEFQSINIKLKYVLKEGVKQFIIPNEM